MEYRKLISFGKSSFVISLPKTWVNGNKLKKGDTVFLDERNADLLLSPKEVSLEEEQKEITIEVDGKPVRRIQREVITAYVMHYKTIILVGNEIKDKAKELQEFIQNLVALEIMEQTSRKIVAKDFLNMNDLSTDNIIRKMDIVTRAMLEDCKNMFTDDVYENINHRDNDVNRLRFLMYRIVWFGLNNPTFAIKKFNLSPISLLNLWWLAFNLEAIADNVKRTARYMREVKLDNKEKQVLKNLLEAISEDYNQMMKGYHTKNPEIAHSILQKKEEMLKQCEDFHHRNRNIPFAGYLTDQIKYFITNLYNIGRVVYQGQLSTP